MEIIASDLPVLTLSFSKEQLVEWHFELERKLKMGVPRRAIFRRLHALIDKVMAADINPHLKCKAGCSHCCYNPVGITLDEAKYIEEMTGAKIINASKQKIPTPEELGHKPCTFLDVESGECTIYTIRPTVCRGFGSFDEPELFCVVNDANHAIFRIDAPFGEGNNTFINATNWMVLSVLAKKSGYDICKDIRQYFGDKL